MDAFIQATKYCYIDSNEGARVKSPQTSFPDEPGKSPRCVFFLLGWKAMEPTLALVARPPGWALCPRSAPPRPDRVRVRIALAGLCRTDIQAMTGLRSVPWDRVLGHEAAGWVECIPVSLAAPARAMGLSEGARVAFFPFLPCGRCPACIAQEPLGHCHAPSALGLDEDGAFAPFVDVPLAVLAPAPASLSWEALAYAEPVAAALSVLTVPEALTAERVAVLGEGRIADLTARVLDAWVPGRPVQRLTVASVPPEPLDVVIETVPTEKALHQAATWLRPGGLLVIKSRPALAVPWPHQAMVLRRLRAVGVAYGSFAEGLAAMASGRLATSSLFGPRFPWTVEGVCAALDQERQGETSGKLFFAIGVPTADVPTADMDA